MVVIEKVTKMMKMVIPNGSVVHIIKKVTFLYHSISKVINDGKGDKYKMVW